MKVEDLIRLLEFYERYDMMEEGKALLKSVLPNGEGEKVEPCFAKPEPNENELTQSNEPKPLPPFPFKARVNLDHYPWKKGDIIEITDFVNESRFDYMVGNEFVIDCLYCTPIENEPEPTETKQELYDKAYAEGYEKAKLEFEEEKKKIQRESYKEGYNNAFHSRDKFMLIYEDNNP